MSHLFADKKINKAKYIAIYAPLPWEVDVTALWEKFPRSVVFPRVVKEHLYFYPVGSLNELQIGYSGILEPPMKSHPVNWKKGDIILVPGYGFDAKGGRVGSGKGFYDRFLEGIQAEKWGVCFQAQIIKEGLAQIPTDVRMDALVSEKGIFRC